MNVRLLPIVLSLTLSVTAARADAPVGSDAATKPPQTQPGAAAGTPAPPVAPPLPDAPPALTPVPPQGAAGAAPSAASSPAVTSESAVPASAAPPSAAPMPSVSAPATTPSAQPATEAATLTARPATPAPNADSIARGARPITTQERLQLRQQWVQQMERERDEISVWPLSLGIAVGVATMAGGAALAVNVNRKGGSVVALAFGLPITLVSSLVLAKRLKRRRAIDSELAGRSTLSMSWLERGGLGFSF